MYLIRRFLVTLSLITCFLQAHGADKYTDENRPYEFGFNIEGEQHRHEKKDEQGLIMGEFGFITADGVYHVTVYATDENGNFKILSMKNIRVKPYPSGPARKPQGKSLELPAAAPVGPSPQAPASVQQTVVTRAPFSAQTPVPSNVRSCSSCKIPTTTTTTKRPPAPSAPVAPREQFPNYNTGSQQPKSQQPNYPQQPSQQPNYPQQPSQNSAAPRYPQQPANPLPSYPQPSQEVAPPRNPQQQNNQPNYQQPQNVNSPNQPGRANPSIDSRLGFAQDEQGPRGPSNYPQGVNTQPQQPQAPQAPASRNPKQYQPNPKQPITKPMLTYVQMQEVPKDTDIYSRKPGEKEGLPPGVSKDTVSTLLYTFNYTLGFHGHHEDGYTNGAKKGYYFVTGRNGIRTRVDYEADENGFRPKLTQEVLDLVSEEVPKPETEKDEKYGLRGYEFKWLYFPDSKSR